MPNAKVRPIMTSSWSGTSPIMASSWSGTSRAQPLRLTDKWEDDYGSGCRHGPEYWHVRSAFLSSYHFSEDRSFKDKLKRSMKEVNEAVGAVASNIRREISSRNVRVRTFQIRFSLSSLFVGTVRCFVPWFNKRELQIE